MIGRILLMTIATTWFSSIVLRAASAQTPGWGNGAAIQSETEVTENLARQEKAEEQLDRIVEEIRFQHAAFTEVIDELRRISGLNIIPNWEALEAQAIEKDAEISLYLKKVRVRTVLQFVLEQVSGGAIELAYLPDGDLIRLSTLEDLSQRTTIVVYAVRDLLKAETLKPNATHGSAGISESTALEKLSDVVMTAVQPESWREHGGNTGSLSIAKGAMVVRQSSLAQAEIQRLLDHLRATQQCDKLLTAEARARFEKRKTREQNRVVEILETERKLAQIAPKIQFEGMPLEEAIVKLRNLSGTNIILNWAELEAHAVEQDAEVSLSLEDVGIGQVLRQILDYVSEGEVDLSYVIDGPVVWVTTDEELLRRRATLVYDIHRLLKTIPNVAAVQRRTDIREAPNDQQSENTARQVLKSDSPAQRFAANIRASVDPESWRESGGMSGSISVFGDALVITHSVLVHQKIDRLLDGLARAAGVPPADEVDNARQALAAAAEARAAAETAETKRRLGQEVSSIEFQGISLKAALEKIGARSGVNLSVSWAAMEAQAIEKDSEVKLRLHNMSFGEVLTAILDTSGDEVELAYLVEGKIAYVSTLGDLSRQRSIVVYPVSDLLTAGDKGVGGSEQKASVAATQSDSNSATPRSDANRLADLILKTVDPESWREAGGNIGTIAIFNDSFAIYQTKINHGQIRKMLNDMRAAQNGRRRDR